MPEKASIRGSLRPQAPLFWSCSIGHASDYVRNYLEGFGKQIPEGRINAKRSIRALLKVESILAEFVATLDLERKTLAGLDLVYQIHRSPHRSYRGTVHHHDEVILAQANSVHRTVQLDRTDDEMLDRILLLSWHWHQGDLSTSAGNIREVRFTITL